MERDRQEAWSRNAGVARQLNLDDTSDPINDVTETRDQVQLMLTEEVEQAKADYKSLFHHMITRETESKESTTDLVSQMGARISRETRRDLD